MLELQAFVDVDQVKYMWCSAEPHGHADGGRPFPICRFSVVSDITYHLATDPQLPSRKNKVRN